RDYLRSHTGWMSIAFALMVVAGATLGALSYMMQPLFNLVFVGGQADAIWWVGAAILGLFVLRAVTSIINKTILTRVAQRTSTTMQVDLLRRLLTLDGGFFQENPPGA